MLRLRPATIEDAALLRSMICELAEYEHELDQVTIGENDLRRDGFGEKPRFRALIAEWDGQTAGYALFFEYFSTWVGRGLYLEDLFVREQFRGLGIGTALLAHVARIALDEQCLGMRWEVLNWNTKAIAMYRKIGAGFPDRWRRVLLSGEALQHLAKRAL